MEKVKTILYHQDSCGQCRLAEMLLKKENIDFDSCKDIYKMKELGITSTPTLSVNGKLYHGAKEIKEWLVSRG